MASGQIGTALSQIRRLFDGGAVGNFADSQLLERFVSWRDEEAFTALVALHGPMVLAVCRRILKDRADLDDAFQATFLILVRKARSVRAERSLGGWLHRVAHRVAAEANREAACRQRRERRAAVMSRLRGENEASHDFEPALYEELARLPDRHRLPLVLCYLEGKTQAEAAAELHWSGATLRRRLAEARDRLRARLTRRGVAAPTALVTTALLSDARATVPRSCVAATVRAATISGGGRVAISTAVSTLTERVIRSMLMANFKTAATIAATAVAIAWIAASLVHDRALKGAPPSAAPQQALAQAGPSTTKTNDEATTPLAYAGLVIDPEGKPFKGATLYVEYFTSTGSKFHKGAVSGRDGRFRFEVERSAFDKSRDPNPWTHASVAATADGYGPVWMNASTPQLPGTMGAESLTLRLARDDVPIVGRILDLDGLPVAGATIEPYVLQYRQNREGIHIPWDSNESGPRYMGTNVAIQGLFPRVVTDADGRFRLTGIGRDRMVEVSLSGPKIATQSLELETRPGRMQVLDGFGPFRNGKKPPPRIRYGATFTHAAAPDRIIAGVVRERGTDRPIAGATINLRTAADAGGKFRLEGLPMDDEHSFYVAAPAQQPYFARQVTIKVKDPSMRVVMADIELARGILASGQVKEKGSGKPVRGFVSYFPLKGNLYTEDLFANQFTERRSISSPTSEDGRFALPIPPGRGVLVIQAGTGDNVWYPPARRVAPEDKALGITSAGDDALLDTVPRPTSLMAYSAYIAVDLAKDSSSIERDIIVDPGRERRGSIVDQEGKALSEVTVFGLRDLMFESWGTKVDRQFTARALTPGHPRRVFFLHEGRKLAGHVDLRADEPAEVTVRLRPCGALTGRLVDAKGNPIAGSRFRLVYDDAEGIPHVTFPPGRRVLTEAEQKREALANGYDDGKFIIPAEASDARGQFRIEDIVPETTFQLSAMPVRADKKFGPNGGASIAEATLAKTSVRPGQTLDLGDVRLKDNALKPVR